MARSRRHAAVCGSVGKVTACLLLSFLAATPKAVGAWTKEWGNAEQAPLISLPPSTGVEYHPSMGQEHKFYPRHIFHHGLYTHPNLHRRLDVKPEDSKWTTAEMGGERVRREPLHAKSQQMTIQRLSDRRIPIVDSLMQEARLTGVASTLSPSAWTMDELYGPNVTDKDTVVNLAKMTSDSYILKPGTGDWSWLDIGIGMNYSKSFGWESDGLRGHIFADENNSTIVIALKGTSPAVFDGVETTTNDKINDNLFFGCCCGQGGQYLWRRVCDCQSSAYTCNQTCLVKALKNENRYYRASIELYGNVTELYPDSDIWLTGHSLGGSVTSLLGMTFGLPVVTFEAPGEALAATRLGLPSPPGADPSAPQTRKNTGSYHFGHTADPIFMGTCNTATSGCTLGGYAMETQCHTGNICVYDTVKDKSWRAGIVNHKIKTVILDVLEAYDKLATCELDSECFDCFNWKYFESNGTESTTSSSSISSTFSQTRTTTCKTPGWWGCLDETTTTSRSISSSTPWSTSSTSSTTSSCKTPGWFGCRDKTTTLMPAPAPIVTATSILSTASYTSASTSYPLSITSSCKTPGWFWCKDKTTYKSAPAPTVTATSTEPNPSSPSTAATKCETSGLFWGCLDRVTTPSAHAITSLRSAIPTA